MSVSLVQRGKYFCQSFCLIVLSQFEHVSCMNIATKVLAVNFLSDVISTAHFPIISYFQFIIIFMLNAIIIYLSLSASMHAVAIYG